jgi:hypothetical protein
VWRRLPFVVVALCAVGAARADAATYCVGARADGCVAKDTPADAFSAARADADRDTILLGRLTAEGAFADAPGRPVRLLGVGADATRLRPGGSGPTLRLQDAGSSAAELRLDGGSAPALQVDAGAAVSSALVFGRVLVRGGEAELSSVVANGIEATCEAATARLDIDHATVFGSGDAGVRGNCATAGRSVSFSVDDSIVWGFSRAFAPGASTTGATNTSADPAFAAPGDWRLRPDSPLVDAGRPGALSESESHEDALGYVRIVDGDADGTPRRDIGAHEVQPPAPPAAPGNVLSNPSAEAGTPASDDRSSPVPPGWARTGSFTFVRYGTVAGLVPFPSERVADALSAGEAFFAAGPGKDNTATQVTSLADAAPEIDLGQGTVTLSGLLGGYRASADGAIAEAVFRGPGGGSLGSMRIGPVTAADRANATTLLPRAASGAIPPLTRTIAVTLRSTPAAGSYDDAYFDDLALAPRVAGGAPYVSPEDSPGRRLRPFAGVSLLNRRTAIDSRRRAWVRLACASAVVRSCTGVLTIAARLSRGAAERRIASRAFQLRRGRVARLSVKLTRAGGRALAGRRRLPGHLYLAARDGQGLTRTSTSPVRVVRGRGRR